MACARVYDSWSTRLAPSARPSLVPASRPNRPLRAIETPWATDASYVRMTSNATMSDSPLLPPRIAGLHDLSTDLWWVWHREAREVFRQLDYKVWRLTSHNPVRMLRLVSPERLDDAAKDPTFLTLYDEALRQL